jgi:hypothetical protein
MVSVNDAEGYERTSTSKMNSNVARMNGPVLEKRRIAARNFINEMEISFGSCQRF